MEIATLSATAISVRYIIYPIKKHIGYVFKYRSKVWGLVERFERLENVRARMLRDIGEAQRNGEEISVSVRIWLEKADMMITEARHVLEQEAESTELKCFIGLCPNVKSRFNLGRIADRQAMAIVELLEEGLFDKVSYRADFGEMPLFPASDFEVFPSRSDALNKIMKAFRDDNLSVIGVYGMPGVGKTSLVKEFVRQAQEAKLFDSVAMAVVTLTPDIMKIQDQIADFLGLKFEEQSTIMRAYRLRARLKREQKILVVLDDIWGGLDLTEIGIPSGDEHMGCKLLLTSRNQNVLDYAQENILVEVLEENEAWDLFKKTAGISVESPELRSIALKIAKRCAGLPVAIVTVARALRNKGLFAWMDALRMLQGASLRDFREIELTLKLSYDFLRSEEVKQTFLLCSLLGHHAAVDDLLKYTMGLGLFSAASTVEECRNRLFTVLDELKGSSLLHESYTNDRFDMHDLSRDVAISIASTDKNAFAVKREDVLMQWPDEERMKKCEWIGLQYATVTELPDDLKCPRLTFFCMDNKDPSLKMPPNFFKETRKLRVLNLTKFHFSSLPSSICLLTDLCTLCLDHCVLGSIAGIGELKNLEILSLLGSDIEALPSEMGHLLKLKLLDLSGCTQLKVIPSSVLSRLSRLEELYLGDSFDQWKTGGNDDDQRSYASLAEFRHLLNLSTLDIHIRDDRIMPKDLFFTGSMQRYKVFIGDVWDWSGKFEYSRTLKLKLNRSIDLHPGVKILLKDTEDLYLDELKGIKNVLYDLHGEGFPHLINLHVQRNVEIFYIVNAMNRSPIKAFPSLESLFLNKLINLEKICRGQLEAGSFSKLRTFKVRCCGRLMNLLSFSMVKGLPQLQEFEVTDCKNIIELAFQEGEVKISEIEATGEIEFPQLRFLTIQNLPKLISFCSDDKRHSISQQGNLPSTSGTTISLFDEKVIFYKLEYLKLCALNIQILWRDQLPQVSSSLRNLTALVVEGCNNLKYLFSSLLVDVLVELKTMEISGCKFLVDVIAPEESVGKILLPKLVSLSLHGLPELKRFCVADCIVFPVLKELSIRNCPLFNVFIPSSVIRSTYGELVEGDNSRENTYTDRPPLFNDQVSFPDLEKLIVIGLQNLKNVWHSQFKPDSFSELKYLEVGLCEELKNIFPIEMLERLRKLNELHIYNCDSLQVIFEPHESETAIKLVFPSVAYLQLYMLPNLKSLYPKSHTTEWPSLQKIQVCGCEKVHVFASEALGFQRSQLEGHLEMSIKQSLFWVNKNTFPCLQELWLERNSIMKRIWQGQQIPADQYFPKLEVLKLIYLPKESTILSSFFRSFSKIPELVVSDASFGEIFQCRDFAGEKEDAWKLDQLSKLSLCKLPELTDLWKEGSLPQLLLKNLDSLKILGCGRLKNLVPSSVSFQNLTTLEVSKCHGFIYLITPSTAKGMGQLKRMSITDCGLMEEIIAHEDNGLMDGLVFPKLSYLRLQNLPSLTSFYSGNDKFHLPPLDELVVRECPEMEYFHKGELTTVRNLTATIKVVDTKKSQNRVKELGLLQWNFQKLWVSTV